MPNLPLRKLSPNYTPFSSARFFPRRSFLLFWLRWGFFLRGFFRPDRFILDFIRKNRRQMAHVMRVGWSTAERDSIFLVHTRPEPRIRGSQIIAKVLLWMGYGKVPLDSKHEIQLLHHLHVGPAPGSLNLCSRHAHGVVSTQPHWGEAVPKGKRKAKGEVVSWGRRTPVRL